MGENRNMEEGEIGGKCREEGELDGPGWGKYFHGIFNVARREKLAPKVGRRGTYPCSSPVD